MDSRPLFPSPRGCRARKLSIPLNGFPTLGNLLGYAIGRWAFQFHWMDSQAAQPTGSTRLSFFQFHWMDSGMCGLTSDRSKLICCLSIPLNGFTVSRAVLALWYASLFFQFHWMDSTLFRSMYHTAYVTFNSIEWIHIFYGPGDWDVGVFQLSIPLNGFTRYGSAPSITGKVYALSIPLNGFG